MTSAYDAAYQRILALERIPQDAKLLQMASAARISFELGGSQLETAVVQLYAFISRAAELDTASLLKGDAVQYRDASISALAAVGAYIKKNTPSVYERIQKKYGDIALGADAIKP